MALGSRLLRPPRDARSLATIRRLLRRARRHARISTSPAPPPDELRGLHRHRSDGSPLLLPSKVPVARKALPLHPVIPHRLLRRQEHPPRRLSHRRQPPPAPAIQRRRHHLHLT